MDKESEENCESAGVVVIINDEGVKKFLLMRVMNYWDFPKGKIEKNENKIQAAIREVKEETGLEDLDFKWSKVYYSTFPYGIKKKRVHYFIAETKNKKILIEKNPNTGIVEHEEYRWLSFEEAKKIVNKRVEKVLIWANEKINSFK